MLEIDEPTNSEIQEKALLTNILDLRNQILIEHLFPGGQARIPLAIDAEKLIPLVVVVDRALGIMENGEWGTDLHIYDDEPLLHNDFWIDFARLTMPAFAEMVSTQEQAVDELDESNAGDDAITQLDKEHDGIRLAYVVENRIELMAHLRNLMQQKLMEMKGNSELELLT